MKDVFDIVSLDLKRSGSSEIDIRKFFPLSKVHAVRGSYSTPVDTLRPKNTLRRLDFSFPHVVSTQRFHTYQNLDLAHQSLAKKRKLSVGPYPSDSFFRINICPPLDIPYGVLDVRNGPLAKGKLYPDLYPRSLPMSIHSRRVLRGFGRILKKRRKPLALTIGVFLLLAFPIVFYTKSLLDEAYSELLSIRTAGSRDEVIDHIHNARGNFERANILFTPFRILPGDQVRFAKIVLDGGLALSRGLDTMAEVLPVGQSNSGETITTNIREDSTYRPNSKNIYPLLSLGIDDPTGWIKENRSSLQYLEESLRKAGEHYALAEDIEQERAGEIAHIGRGLQKISLGLSFFLKNESDLLALLGSEVPERYIVFNQNRDEIRANGGFPGSVISFTLFRGNIEDYRSDDVYYYDWNLYPFQELPPPGLALLSNNYGLRDVNYYPDFRDTLEKANAFIEKSGDPTVTVGIALHQGILENILETVSPISLSGVAEPFDRENFSSLMSVLVESRFQEETSAKDILRKFIDAFAHKVQEKRAYEEVFTEIEQAIKDGEILFASRNEKIDTFLEKYRKPLPWTKYTLSADSGALLTQSGEDKVQFRDTKKNNWIYPLFTSLSGNKSDRLMQRRYSGETTRVGECTYMNKITLTHKHTYNTAYEKKILSYLSLIGIREKATIEKMLAIQGKGKNKTFLRFYVPESATLTGSTADIVLKDIPEGKEISFTLETNPNSTATKTFRYTTKIDTCSAEIPLLEWYRQPGLQNTLFESK